MSKKKPKPPTDWCDVVTCTCGTVMQVSDYTPTKLEVRSQYAQDASTPDEYVKAVTEFDRWLEAHNAEVVKETEERIIKLLEKHRISLKDITAENWVGLWHDAIKQIKGEQK